MVRLLSDVGNAARPDRCTPRHRNNPQPTVLNPEADVNNNRDGLLGPNVLDAQQPVWRRSPPYRGTGSVRTAASGCWKPPSTRAWGGAELHQRVPGDKLQQRNLHGRDHAFMTRRRARARASRSASHLRRRSTVSVANSAAPSVKLDKFTAGGCTPKQTTVASRQPGPATACVKTAQNGLFVDLVRATTAWCSTGTRPVRRTRSRTKRTFFTTRRAW